MSETPYRVLVVDDLPQNVLLAKTVLRAMGCEVETAGDGAACLEAVARRAPDLVLLDVMMPMLDGFEVCRRLKADTATRHIPVVLLTSLESTEDRVTGIEAGADEFISKPFNRQELMARVRSLLRVKRLEERARSHVRGTLERYLDSSVAQEMLDRPELAAPGGRRVDASVLFVDIRGFSTWSEATPPESVVEVMNRFLSRSVEAVFAHGGMVDKFTGDGLMALFGVPLGRSDHARCAVAAALEIVRTSAAIRHERLSAPLRVGCGVNSGQMVVGNIGSERRLDYTAIGDAVNVARRLCEEAAGGEVLVSEATAAALDVASLEDRGPRAVKGRQEPVRTFAVSEPPNRSAAGSS